MWFANIWHGLTLASLCCSDGVTVPWIFKIQGDIPLLLRKTEYKRLFWVAAHKPHSPDAPLLKLMTENYHQPSSEGQFIKTVTISPSTLSVLKSAQNKNIKKKIPFSCVRLWLTIFRLTHTITLECQHRFWQICSRLFKAGQKINTTTAVRKTHRSTVEFKLLGKCPVGNCYSERAQSVFSVSWMTVHMVTH